MTTNGWCFRLASGNGPDVLYVNEQGIDAAKAAAKEHLDGRTIEREHEIPQSVLEFLEISPGHIVTGVHVS